MSRANRSYYIRIDGCTWSGGLEELTMQRLFFWSNASVSLISIALHRDLELYSTPSLAHNSHLVLWVQAP
jgi:hypothetical protein